MVTSCIIIDGTDVSWFGMAPLSTRCQPDDGGQPLSTGSARAMYLAEVEWYFKWWLSDQDWNALDNDDFEIADVENSDIAKNMTGLKIKQFLLTLNFMIYQIPVNQQLNLLKIWG